MAAPPLPELRDSVRKMPKRTKRTGSQPTVNSTGIKLGIVAKKLAENATGARKSSPRKVARPNENQANAEQQKEDGQQVTNKDVLAHLLQRLKHTFPNCIIKNPEGRGGCLFLAGGEAALDVEMQHSIEIKNVDDIDKEVGTVREKERVIELAARTSIWALKDSPSFGTMFATRTRAAGRRALPLDAEQQVLEVDLATALANLQGLEVGPTGQQCLLSVRTAVPSSFRILVCLARSTDPVRLLALLFSAQLAARTASGVASTSTSASPMCSTWLRWLCFVGAHLRCQTPRIFMWWSRVLQAPVRHATQPLLDRRVVQTECQSTT